MATQPLPTKPAGDTATTEVVAAVGTASAEILAASTSRKRLILHNPSNVLIGYRLTTGTAVLGGAGSFTLYPGQTDIWDGAEAQGRIMAIAAAAATPITVVTVS
jgi:hypothetical protein